MQWTVIPEYKDANHHPVVEIVGLEGTIVKPGQTITLKAIVKDPDGDHLTGRWAIEEAGTYPGKVELGSVGAKSITEVERTNPFNIPTPGSPEIARLRKMRLK
jgi:hypothetical protein